MSKPKKIKIYKTHDVGLSISRKGATCGGVINKSMFDSDPMAYMMCYYLEDKDFEFYKTLKNEKVKREFFNKYAKSAI